jgi:hypothetical protein
LFWEKLLTKVTLPPEVTENEKWMEKVKEWTLGKAAEQFRTHKKTIWKYYCEEK